MTESQTPATPATPTPATPAPAASTPPAGNAPPAQPNGENVGDTPPATPSGEPATPPGEAAPNGEPATPPYEFQPLDGVEIDSAVLERATPILSELKALNVPPEIAQQLVEFHAKELQAAFEGALSPEVINEHVQAAMTTRSEQWAEEAKRDPEIGGSKFDAVATEARNAVGQLGSPAFKKLMIDTGLGNNVEFVRVFAKINKMLTEDRGGLLPSGDGTPKPLHERMYPNMVKK